MPIKNIDGSIYRLNSPNPVMSNQDFWNNGSKFILHNFNYSDEVILHNFEEPEVKPKFQSLEDIEVQEIEVPIKETPIAKKPRKRKNIIMIYCMPAIINETYDSLYDENRVSVSYGQQFTLEAIVTKLSDIQINLWTTTEKAVRGSIIYMPENLRWWKVDKLSNKDEGYVLECIPSNLQPSFAT